MDDTGSASSEFAGRVKRPDVATVRTSPPESLEPPNKTPTLSKECSFSASNALHHKTSPPSSKVPPSSINQWKEKAFQFYDQVAQQVERLLLSFVEDEASIKTRRDELNRAHVSSGHCNTMIQTLDTFSRNTNALVMLLQRIKLQQPEVLEPLLCS